MVFTPAGSALLNVQTKKKDTLKNIIDKVNERFGGIFDQQDRAAITTIYQMVMQSPNWKNYQQYAKNNKVDMFVRSQFPDIFKLMTTKYYLNNKGARSKLYRDNAFYNNVRDIMAEEVYWALQTS